MWFRNKTEAMSEVIRVGKLTLPLTGCRTQIVALDLAWSSSLPPAAVCQLPWAMLRACAGGTDEGKLAGWPTSYHPGSEPVLEIGPRQHPSHL